MKEPIRWLDDPETGRALLDVLRASQEAPALPEQAHAQMAMFAGGLAAQAIATKATIFSSWLKLLGSFLGIHGAGKTVAIVAMLGAIGTGSYVGVRHYIAHMAAIEAVSSQRAAAEPMPVPAAKASDELEATESLRAAEAVSPSERVKSAPYVAPVRSIEPRAGREEGPAAIQGQSGAGSFDELSIADEARLLEKARARLTAEPAQALEVANTHERLYPTGQLSAEREFIAVDALMRLGRRTEAEQRAEPRLRQFPNGLYAKRLRKLLNN